MDLRRGHGPRRGDARRARPGRGPSRRRAAGTVDVPDGAAPRPARAPARDAARLGHRPVQLPLRLLHAEGGLRPRVRVPRAQASCSRSKSSRASPASSRSLGVRTVRITGGEPLVRRNVEHLVELLAAIDTPNGDKLELALTTNGSVARAEGRGPRRRRPEPRHGQPRLARRRGVPRDERRRLPGAAGPRGDRRGRGGRAAGEGQRGRQARRRTTATSSRSPSTSAAAATSSASSSSWTSARRTAGGSRTSSRADEIVQRIARALAARAGCRRAADATARRWRYVDGAGEIGVIASVTQPFCGGCSRARLSAEGRLYTCLFAARGHDLRAPLRLGASDEELAEQLRGDLDTPHRPLLRAADGGNGFVAEGRDVATSAVSHILLAVL